MNERNPEDGPRYAILIADDCEATRVQLVEDIQAFCGGLLDVEDLPSAAALAERAQILYDRGIHIPMVIADQVMPEGTGIALLMQLHENPAFRHTSKILLTRVTTLQDVDQALGMGALNGHLPKPWKTAQLHSLLRMRLTEFFIRHAPHRVSEFSDLLDVAHLSEAFVNMEGQRKDLDSQVRTLKRNFLADFRTSDADVEAAMLQGLRAAIDNPEPIHLSPGQYLLREGKEVDGIWIVLSGRVQLMRTINGKPIIFHAQSVGRIIGLLALSLGKTSFFDCRAETETTAIRLSVDDLHQALETHPLLSNHFVTVLVRTLARRNRRSVELQLEINALRRNIESERDQLASALSELKNTQTLLVEHEKMATLGEMSAGIAHELNNPVAALSRAGEFLRTDIRALSRHCPAGELVSEMLEYAYRLEKVSTREERKARKELAADLGDEELARQLVHIGIRTRDDVGKFLGTLKGPAVNERLKDLASAYNLGTALRNVRSCTQRISSLVQSLRSYARADEEIQEEIDIHNGIEETLLLFGNQLRNISINREYGQLPGIQCIPGQLHQVWTNLISNAIQAMEGEGSITIRTGMVGTDAIRVDIEDNGPGIAPEHLEHVFEVNFTTRQGQVDFGLGIGLPICQEIIARHHGSLGVSSRPGQTIFSTILPIRVPKTAAFISPAQ